MGADDDADCVEHVWELRELGLRRRRMDVTSVCARCGAVRYEPAQATDRARPPL